MGYDLFYSDIDGRAGGVALYVLKELSPISVNIERLSSKEKEQTWCFVNFGTESILLGNKYRPGNVNRIKTKEIMQSLKSAHGLLNKRLCTGICICGDFSKHKLE